jgi:hypothetical protein
MATVFDSAALEKKRAYARAHQAERRVDPAYRAKAAARWRDWYAAKSPEEQAKIRRDRHPLKYDAHVKAYQSHLKKVAKAERDRVRLRKRWREMSVEDKAARSEKKTKYTASNGGKAKRVDSTLRRKFGITCEQWKALFEHQGGVCAVCGTDDPGGKGTWNTDHCHATQTLRGILCHGCNSGLGHFKDNIAALDSAKAYLQRAPASEIGLAVPGAAIGKLTIRCRQS